MSFQAIFAAFTLATAAIGIGIQAKAQKKAAKASRAAERLRQRQADLAAQRERRRQIREGQLARASILSNAAEGNAQYSVQGQLQQPAADTARSILNVNQSFEIGRGIFAYNREISRQQGRASTGQGVQNFAESLFTQRDEANRLYNYTIG